MIGLILLKTLLKIGAVTAKTSAVRKASISGVIIASGLDEISRKNRYDKPRQEFKNKNRQKDDDDIKMIE